MKICFLPSGSHAAAPSYQIREREERVACSIGDPISFSSLCADLKTLNPCTTGCFAGEGDLDPEQLTRNCLIWILRWGIGGADPASVPFFLTAHREPCLWSPTGFRTVVHFSILNCHLGLMRSFRPYVHWRDFKPVLEWQNTLNLRDGMRIPTTTTSSILAFTRATDPASARVQSLLREGLNSIPSIDAEAAPERIIECVVEIANAHKAWDIPSAEEYTEPPLGHAILLKTNYAYYLQFENGRRIEIGCDRRSTRSRARAAGVRKRTNEMLCRSAFNIEEAGAIFERLTQRRIALFNQDYGSGWHSRMDLDDNLRNFLVKVRKPEIEQPGIDRETERAIDPGADRTPDRDPSHPPRDY